MNIVNGLTFLLVLTRIAAMVMTAPIFGSLVVPLRMRVALSVVLAVCTFSLIPVPVGITEGSLGQLNFQSLLAHEVMIGTALGLGVSIVFSAARMSGTVLSTMAGIHIGKNLDPQNGQGGGPLGQLFNILSLAAFALIGGPEMMVSATLDTFQSFPIGGTLNERSLIGLIPDLLQQSFMLTLRAISPAIAALMISTFVMGWLSRTYPQMNMLGLGLNSNLIVMFLAVGLTLGGSVWLFVDDVGQYVDMIREGLMVQALEHQPRNHALHEAIERIPVMSEVPPVPESVEQTASSWWGPRR